MFVWKVWFDILVEVVEMVDNFVVFVGYFLGCILIVYGVYVLKDKVRGVYFVVLFDWDWDGLVDGFDGGDFWLIL